MAAQILKTSTNVKATAALQEDGSVVVGGDKKFGGDPSFLKTTGTRPLEP